VGQNSTSSYILHLLIFFFQRFSEKKFGLFLYNLVEPDHPELDKCDELMPVYSLRSFLHFYFLLSFCHRLLSRKINAVNYFQENRSYSWLEQFLIEVRKFERLKSKLKSLKTRGWIHKALPKIRCVLFIVGK